VNNNPALEEASQSQHRKIYTMENVFLFFSRKVGLLLHVASGVVPTGVPCSFFPQFVFTKFVFAKFVFKKFVIQKFVITEFVIYGFEITSS